MATTPAVESPDWWVARLYRQLNDRRSLLDTFDDYYSGNHPLPWLAPQARDEFRRILRMTRSNYMGLVVDAYVERMAIEGFRLGETAGESDQDTWRIWQANNADAASDQAFLEAAIGGCAYVLVAPNPRDASTPYIWFEHASQAIVEAVPGTNGRERAAGLKAWTDDWTGNLYATLYLPDGLYKYQAATPPDGVVDPRWTRREVVGEPWPAPNVVAEVPLLEIPNRPRMLYGGISELADITDTQDRINKTIADRLMTQDYGAFPQKWASAWPEEDADGNPLPPIDVGRNRMVTTDVAETKFGQWDAAPLDPYSAAKREDVKDIASRTRTPAQYLLGEMSNVNGETLKAAESGLVSKVRQQLRYAGEPIEDAVRLLRRLAGIAGPGDAGLETIWRNPEYRTEGEVTDAAIKRLQAGVASLRQTREDVGYSATTIARLEQDDMTERRDPILEAALRASAAPSGAAANGG